MVNLSNLQKNKKKGKLVFFFFKRIESCLEDCFGKGGVQTSDQ